MTIKLRPVAKTSADIQFLYELLEEREPWQSISHKEMPTHEDHATFVWSHPYTVWYIITAADNDHGIPQEVGSIYLTYNNEIGISILKAYHGLGYGKEAVELLMDLYKGPFLANINPNNEPSCAFFESLGFKLLQVTYSHE